jgi:hypothetical protein
LDYVICNYGYVNAEYVNKCKYSIVQFLSRINYLHETKIKPLKGQTAGQLSSSLPSLQSYLKLHKELIGMHSLDFLHLKAFLMFVHVESGAGVVNK